MKKLLSKIPAMFALLLTGLSFFCYIQSFIDTESDIWILSVMVAVLSMFFYFIDAIISLVRAIKKDDSKFNFLLVLVFVGAIPMILFFAGSGRDAFNVIWNIYYLLMVVLQIISIKKACKSMKDSKKVD